MKKILKVLFLNIVLFILTGCSGNYNININEDLSIDEELNLTLLNQSDLYSETIKIFQNYNVPKNNYDVTIKNGDLEILYKEKYDSIEEYVLNSIVYKQVFDDLQYNITPNYIDLYIDGNIKQQNNISKINGSNLVDFDVIQINISNPYKVKFNNAEIINDNVYTWSLKKDDNHKKIHIQFKPSLDKFPYKPVIVGSLILIISISMILILLKKFKLSKKV